VTGFQARCKPCHRAASLNWRLSPSDANPIVDTLAVSEVESWRDYGEKESKNSMMLGVSKCPGSPHLADLPGSRNAADSFYEYLIERFELPGKNIKDLFDSRKSPSEQLREIGDWLSSGKEILKDLLVFYTGQDDSIAHRSAGRPKLALFADPAGNVTGLLLGDVG
jgi:hypothetical protein